MLETVNHYRSLTFDDLESKVEYSEGIPSILCFPPWRYPFGFGYPQVIDEVLGIQFYLL